MTEGEEQRMEKKKNSASLVAVALLLTGAADTGKISTNTPIVI